MHFSCSIQCFPLMSLAGMLCSFIASSTAAAAMVSGLTCRLSVVRRLQICQTKFGASFHHYIDCSLHMGFTTPHVLQMNYTVAACIQPRHIMTPSTCWSASHT